MIRYSLVLCMFSYFALAIEYCSEVENRCFRRLGCGNALHNFQLVCARQLSGETDECTEECQKALISLMARDVGYDYITCECRKGIEKYSDCGVKKRNLQVCKSVLDAAEIFNDPSKQITCSIAHWICDTDSSCSNALDYYKTRCGNLKEIGSCPERCNSSINILYQQKYAFKLQNCICDELLEDFNCSELQQNTREYCFKDKYSVVNNNKQYVYSARHDSNGFCFKDRVVYRLLAVTVILLQLLL